ncbi:hypothetical protein SGCZBJ_01935 [Caulobacter zeae]|uniref:UspA domain-containing protein n=1 Tax=Caulobacter zeae TaxID=2055137 RepID=A0A2N5DRG2_9CAUL|nr:universal stress protein [Caulobacter zeae]PLR28635.1 hypothetical protein SGCZBJ_01935 [Caulobacter zeae]
MSIADIIVQVDASDASGGRAQFAARLADHLRAQLTGVFLRPSITDSYLRDAQQDETALKFPPSLIKAYDAMMDEVEGRARSRFEDVVGERACGRAWRRLNGDFCDDLIGAMLRTDLTVLGPGRARIVIDRTDAAGLALASGAPILIVPDGALEGPVARRIMVAWNGRREAARALRQAWPLLTAADRVSVLTVGTVERSIETGALRGLFAHHNVAAEFIVRPGDDADAGAILLAEAERLGADLIVMGLFGHARWREWALGGASREMIQRSWIPLFLAH